MIDESKIMIQFGKKFGGDLLLEEAWAVGRKDSLIPKLEEELNLPDDIIRLGGLVSYKGSPQQPAVTSYVLGLGIYEGTLFVITKGSVYRLVGEFYPDVIKGQPHLNKLWEDLKVRTMLHA